MSDIYIIGTLSREDVIEEAALDYLRLEDATRIVAVPHRDGTCGEGTQYEIAYAKFLRKKVTIWKGETE